MFLYEEEDLIPKQQTKQSAGLDLKSKHEIEIKAGEAKIINTGVWLDREYINQNKIENIWFAVMIRSSLAIKKDLILSNSVGVIDADYDGEILLKIRNMSNKNVKIDKFERVAQIIIMSSPMGLIENVFKSDIKRDGGIGSTGKK